MRTAFGRNVCKAGGSLGLRRSSQSTAWFRRTEDTGGGRDSRCETVEGVTDLLSPGVTAETRVRTAQAEFDAEGVYLNTASLGLPPRRCVEALRATIDAWRTGRASPPDYDASVNAARRAYAGLVGVDPARVALGSQVSVFVGLVAAALPDHSEVVCVEGEFTSLLFPFLAQAGRGVQVREVPLEHLLDAITGDTDLVAVSAVQSADGRLADLAQLASVADAAGVRVLLDTTQATGWLPIDAERFAYTVGGGYKWLLAPRGTCFFTVQPDVAPDLIPHAAGWYAGADPWLSIYGPPLRLAEDARRFDLSPVWHSWVAQALALDVLTEVGIHALHAHAVGLANRFRVGVGIAPGDSAIVSVTADPESTALMTRAGIAGSVRAGRLRLSFHINNSTADADRAAEVLIGHVRA